MTEHSDDDRRDFATVGVRLPVSTLCLAEGLLDQQGTPDSLTFEDRLGTLVDKSIQLYEAMWRMQTDGGSFFVDNIRAPMGDSEVRAQRSISQARTRTSRRVLLLFKVR